MENLIKKAFGIQAVINPCKAPKGLPYYMTNGRHFYQLELAGITSLLIELSESEKFGVIAFEKQLTRYIEGAVASSAGISPPALRTFAAVFSVFRSRKQRPPVPSCRSF